MLSNFKTYQLSVQFYQACLKLKLPRGSAKPTKKGQMKFFFIAFGSLRECQAILSLSGLTAPETLALADHIGACLYKLTKA
jgi:hypothetical protein